MTITDIRLSYSTLTRHRECPQAFNYQYVQNYQRLHLDPPVKRILGSWWHALRAADSMKRGMAKGTIVHSPTQFKIEEDLIDHDHDHPTRWVAARALDYWRGLDNEVKDIWIAEIGEPLPERLLKMDLAWHGRWAADLEHEEPLAVEIEWTREINGRVLQGQVDEVYRDTKRGLIVARDHKSMGSLPTAESVEDLMDSQLHFYGWGVTPILKEFGIGEIQALSYDRARSKMPTPPALTQAGALSKSVTDYDLQTYLDFVGGGIEWGIPDTYVQSGPNKGKPKFGVYTVDPEVVERLSSPSAQAVWHVRTLTPININIVKSHLRSALDTAEDITRTMERLMDRGEAARNFTKRCGYCDYAALCRAQMVGGSDGDYDLLQFGLVQG